MQNGRRTFLWKAAGGLAALAALLSPARALAWRRRRVVCEATPLAVPQAEPLTGVPYRLLVDMTPVCFPDESNVYGGGGLFAWGYSMSGVNATTITAACFLTGTTTPTGTVTKVTPPPPGSGGTPDTWAFSISGLKPGTTVDLKVYYTPTGGTPTVGGTATFTPQS